MRGLSSYLGFLLGLLCDFFGIFFFFSYTHSSSYFSAAAGCFRTLLRFVILSLEGMADSL